MTGALAAILAGTLVLGGGATVTLAESGTSTLGGDATPSSSASSASLSGSLSEGLMPDMSVSTFDQGVALAQVKAAALAAHASTGTAMLASTEAKEVSRDLYGGDTIDLTADASDSSVLNVYNIKRGGTYTFTGSASNVQIKVDSSSSEEVYIWLNGVHIDNRQLADGQNDVAPISVTDSSHVTFRGDPASEKSTLNGPHAAAGIEVQGSAHATFAAGAYIEAWGGDGGGPCAGIGGSSDGKTFSGSESDSGELVFEDGCDVTGHGDGYQDSYDYWDEKDRQFYTYYYGLAGAGIGSAADGHAHSITILGGTVRGYAPTWGADIGSGTPWNTSNGGNVDSIWISGGTVDANGGEHAPGIGAAGSVQNWEAGQVGPITISGGDVMAHSDGNVWIGIGAGDHADLRGKISITGGTVHMGDIGSRYGDVDCEIEIGGSCVYAGSIGYGGTVTDDAEILIDGGTVLASNINSLSDKDAGKVRIWGGSVRAKVDTAHGYYLSNENLGPSVYQVRLAVPDGANKKAKVSVQADGITQYFTNSIQTDENGYIYLYLPVQDGKENTADVTVDGITYHYHDKNTTKSDGSGWLKMDGGVVQFKDDPVYLTPGGTATVALDDAAIQWKGATWTFSADGAATLAEGSNPSSSGAYASVSGKTDAKAGDTYTVTATMEGSSASFWSATGTSRELPIYNSPAITLPDLSKDFDGVPITADDILKSVATPSDGAVHVQLQEYSSWWETRGWNDVDQALNAGGQSYEPTSELYRAIVTTDATSTYASGSITQEFRIYKRASQTSIASIDAVTSDGVLAGWNVTVQVSRIVSGYPGSSVTLYDTTGSGNTKLGSADVPDSGTVTIFVDASVISDPSSSAILASYGGDDLHYLGSEKSFASLPVLPTISVLDLTKTYDGVAITAAAVKPQVSTNAESGAAVRIQQQTGSGWQDVSSAEDAGHYRVLAETQASTAYVAASVSQEFDILEAPTATSVSGVSETSGGVVTGWTVTAKVAGLVPGHADGTVTFYGTAGGIDTQLGSPVPVSSDGMATATISADGVSSGTYTVKAVYGGAANYASSEGSLTASLSLRAISGTASYEKTLGDAPFMLDMATGTPTATDVWTYRLAEDSYGSFVREDGTQAASTVTVSPDGQVSISHAGTALIEVTLTDTSGTYADQTVYVSVTVDKASLVVAPYAYREDPGTPFVSASYGDLDGVKTALRYSYDKGTSWTTTAPAWESGFVGSLAAGSIDTRAGAGTLLVPVEQNEGTFYIGDEAHTGFFSRDYDVSYDSSYAISVGKRALNVTLGDIKGTHGGTAPAFAWTYDQNAQPQGGGLASFDTEATVFQENPALGIDAAVTGSSDFRSLSVKRDADGNVAAYEGAVFATGGSAANYEVTFTRGDLTVEPESLADAMRISASADVAAFTYNGMAQAPTTFAVTDSGSELVEGTDYTIVLPESSADAGDYVVTFTGIGNYTGTATVAYTIAPAPLSVTTASAAKAYDGTPLAKTDGATLEGLVGDETATAIGIGSQVDAGSSSNAYGIVWDGTAKEGNYTVVSESLGTLTVSRRNLTIHTSSATKAYDGTPLTAPGSLEGLAEGDTVTFATTGSQTDPGSSKNSYTLDWDGTAKFTNYDVWEDLGTLTVTQTSDEIVITTGGTFEYDGKPHGASVMVSQLPAGYAVAEATSSATVTHVSDGEVRATADRLKIVDAQGKDVTDKLNIRYVDGTISIIPRRLFVSTDGGSKRYDGKPLTAAKSARLHGLVAGETATVTAAGSQTDAGSSTNTYRIQWGTAQPGDYQISEALGTLTVTASDSSDTAADSRGSASTVPASGNSSSGTPSAGSSAGTSTAKTDVTPDTGDHTASIAIAGIAAAGAVLIALALRLRSRKSRR